MMWKINGEKISRNPVQATKRLIKKIEYKKGIFGQDIRIAPSTNDIQIELEANWRLADQDLHDRLYLLHKSGTPFLLETHLDRDIWTVIITSFTSQHALQGRVTKEKQYDIDIIFNGIQGVIL